MKKLHIITTLMIGMFSYQSIFGQCDISLSDPAPCASVPIFISVDNPNGTYNWDFDNDGTIDASGVSNFYAFPESNVDLNYTITLYQNGVACNILEVLVLATPDPSIGIIPGSGILEDDLIRVCSGTPAITLELYNASTTYATNQSYEINWGEGPVETYDNITFSNTTTITHNYSNYGYYNLTVTTTSNNGCTNVKNYTLYNGSNPSVGLANPGNTVGLCVPATIDFPITNTGSNPTGTIYTVYVSGEVVALFGQDDVPGIFSYTFLESSCGKTTSTGNYQNAYDVQILASNPCGSSQATIEPIELSSPPDVLFTSNAPVNGCEGEPYTFTNASSGLGEVLAGNCTSLSPSWSITPGVPGVHWEIVSGNTFDSEEIEVIFLIPGTYNITMTISSPSCGDGTYSSDVDIFEIADVSASGGLTSNGSGGIPDECLPSIGTFTNLSTGDSLDFVWQVNPSQGWNYVPPFNQNSTDLEIEFTEPGTYTVSLSASGFCESAGWDTTLTVADIPSAIIADIPNACGSATLNFDPSNVTIDANSGTISTIQWSFPGGTPNTSNSTYPNNIVYTTPGTYYMDVTVTNQCGSYTSLSQSFTIEPIGTIAAGNNVVVCETADPFPLSGTPVGGIWSGDFVSETGVFTPSTNSIGDNVLYYSFPDGACLLEDSLIVSVTPSPSLDLPLEQLLCINDAPYDLSAATPIGGTWTGTGINGNTFDPAQAGIGIHSITYTYVDGLSGCFNSETIDMEVVSLPEVFANDTTYCLTPGLVPLPYATPPGGTWSGAAVVGNNFNPVDAGGVGSYTVLYTYGNNNNCMDTEEVIINVIPPAPINAGNDFDICVNNGPIDLSQVASPANGTWNANGSLGLSGAIFNPALAGEGVHVLTYTIGIGNCLVTDNITIVVNPIPVVNTMNDFEVCVAQSSVELSASPSGGQWTANNGGAIIGDIFNPSLSGAGVFSFTYTYTDNNSCTHSNELLITVYDIPNIITTDTTFCNTPGSVTLPFAQPSGGTWSGPGVIGDQFNPQNVGGVGTYILTYSFQDDNACENSATAIITIVEPQTIIAGTNDTLCIDQGLFQLSGFMPLNGLWSGTGILDINNTLFDPTIAGVGIHELTYTAGEGNCMVEDTKFIVVIDLLIDAGPDSSSCVLYNAFLLEDYSPLGGTWSGSGIVNASTGLFDPAVANVGTHVLTYSYTDPISGCTRSDNREITIQSLEQAAFTMPDFACKNEPIQFVNLSPVDYEMQWSFGLGAGTSMEFNPVHTYDAIGTYTVTLIIRNEFGCQDTVSHNIVIADVPVADFVPDISDACSDIPITFTSQSFGDSLSYFWEFGNFQTSTLENPGDIYFVSGFFDTTYVITLTVSNICGSSTYQDIVTIHPGLEADFGIVPLTECSPLMVDFANASTGTALSYFWDFGNGNTSTEQFPDTEAFFTDTTASTYIVTLIATNICGPDTATAEIYVPPANVIAAAEASVDAGCVPLTVNFSNFSSPTATIDWDFGDDNSSSLEEPTHTFTESGTYIVIQYASSDCGYDTMALEINVYPTPEVIFEHPDVVCANQPIQFTNNSTNTSGNFWSFGDGTISELTNPVHSYDSAGVYTVTLLGISIFNQCQGVYTSTITILDLPTAAFEPSTTYGCAPLDVAFENNSSNALLYQWDFGDNNSSIDQSPTHTFEDPGTYEVTLLATDANGCFTDTTIYNVIVTPNPEAAFEYEKEQSCGLPATINFENLSQGAIDFEWRFGQDGISSNTNPSYTFTSAGTYEVSLVAFNQFACNDTVRLSIEIYESPIAEVEIESQNGCDPLEVVFNNMSSYSSEYQWSFGDGASSISTDPVHEYTIPGTYDVQVIATINGTCPDTMTLYDAVEVYPQAFANFETSPYANDGIYEIINLSQNADAYFWEFSDGTTSTDENPTHRFRTNGVHQLYLEASNEYGCVDDTLVSFIPEFVKGLFLPNAFSPEQGIGDVRLFKPKGIGLKEYRIQVFSTYGQLLWESTALDEQGRPAEGWDGIVEGELMPQDVYVWKCSGIFIDGSGWEGVEEDGKHKMMGSLVLLR